MIKEIVYTCQSQFQVIVRVSYVSTCQLHCENILLVGLFPATMQTGFIDKVYKEDTETGTNSHIRRLTDEERVKEIANMLSGATLTEAALNNAKALISG